jgi:hypothetical protein
MNEKKDEQQHLVTPMRITSHCSADCSSAALRSRSLKIEQQQIAIVIVVFFFPRARMRKIIWGILWQNELMSG